MGHRTLCLFGRKKCLFDKDAKSVSVFRQEQLRRRSRKTMESPGCLLSKIVSIFMRVS